MAKKQTKRRKLVNTEYEEREILVHKVTHKQVSVAEKDIKARAAYILLDGAPVFAVNFMQDGGYKLLANELDFLAVKSTGATHVKARVYEFSEKRADIFRITEKLKTENLGAMDKAYLMKTLIDDYSLTQDDVAAFIGASRPAVANTLRLLTLVPEVVGMVESGALSAGHARALVKVPKEKQYAFASESVHRNYSVREMERAVKAYLTPPEVLAAEKESLKAAKNEELRAFIERMRGVLRTKVSLIGNDKKGRIYIDYYSPEDLYRIEEFIDIVEKFGEE
ncbi:MAG: ParB/RepB/Spo0J family partition protein [Clostridia bacterium]|nr:ParB/RepB/Spo0J family partition protein [Clostridia bacterium]